MADRWRDEDRYGRRNEERYASDDYYRGFYGASSRSPHYGYEDRGRDYGGYGGYGFRGYEDEYRGDDDRGSYDRTYGRGDYERGYGRENRRDRGYGREDYYGGYGRYGQGGPSGGYGAGAGYYGSYGSGYGGYRSSSYSGYGTGYGGYGSGYGGYRGDRREDWARESDWGAGQDREPRGWWDRATDEVASWFGDEDAERRRRKDERYQAQHRGKGPRGYTRSDDRIREDVNDRLTDDMHIDASDIDVSVSSGEVTLTGTVTSRFAKRHAEDIAETVSGVKNVQNNLRVKEATTSWVGSGTSASGTTAASSTSGTTTAGGTAGTGSSLYGSSGRA